MKVDTISPEYHNVSPRWKLIRAIIDNCAQEYIRTPDVNDAIRSKQYKDDAILTNFTNLTKVGLTGLVFRKDPVIELPSSLDYLRDNATGGGITLLQFAQHVVGDVLQTGRYGFLIDYHNDGGKAYIKPYVAEAITNWKTGYVNGECVPTLITLVEKVVVDSEDIFCQDTTIQYRALWLNYEGVYVQLVFNEAEELIEVITPTDFNNQPFDRIPFIFAGSENNDWTIDYQPLYDLAVVNLGHYRNSADYEESIFICGQPFAVVNIGEASVEEFNQANPDGFMFGSRKGLVLNGSGNANLLQANANQLVAQAMREKLEQAAAIGARLISPAGGRETAEAAKIRYGSQHSALYTLTTNVESALERAMQLVCKFMGADENDVKFELNDQFYEDLADGNIMTAYSLWWDRNIVSTEELRGYAKRTGIIADGAELDKEVANPIPEALLPEENLP